MCLFIKLFSNKKKKEKILIIAQRPAYRFAFELSLGIVEGTTRVCVDKYTSSCCPQ